MAKFVSGNRSSFKRFFNRLAFNLEHQALKSQTDSIETQPTSDSENNQDDSEEQRPTAYAWFVLFIVFIIRAIH